LDIVPIDTFYLKGKTSAPDRSGSINYFLCLVCGILAVGSKENAIMLPMVILLYDLFLIQGVTKKNIKKYFFYLLIVVIGCLAVALLTLKSASLLDPENTLSGYNVRGFTLLERLLTEPRILLFYISLLLYPMPYRLCFAHDISLSKGLFDPPATIIAIMITLILLGLALLKSKRWPLISFCTLFFFINHAVESTILPLELAFEHRNYIPSMLLFVPIAILFVEGIKFFSTKSLMQFVIFVSLTLVLVSLGHSTFIRNLIWKTDETLWLDAVEKSPNLTSAHHNLGKYYDDIGLKRIAIEHYQKALQLPEGPNRRSHYITSYNMGLIYKALKDDDNARRYLLESVELEPRFSLAYTSLGIMSIEKGQNKDALDYFILALTHDISSQKSRNYTGLALLRQKRFDDAIGQFKKALEANPNDPYALTHIGVAYKFKGEFNKATRYFKKVLGIDSAHPTALLHLIEVYCLTGQEKKAELTAEKLVNLFPEEKLSVLIDKRVIETEPLLEPADLQIISPVLEETLMNKGVKYHALARKLKKHGTRNFYQYRVNENLPLQIHPFTVHGK